MQLMLNFMRKNCKILFAIFQPRAICAPGGFRNSRSQTNFLRQNCNRPQTVVHLLPQQLLLQLDAQIGESLWSQNDRHSNIPNRQVQNQFLQLETVFGEGPAVSARAIFCGFMLSRSPSSVQYLATELQPLVVFRILGFVNSWHQCPMPARTCRGCNHRRKNSPFFYQGEENGCSVKI